MSEEMFACCVWIGSVFLWVLTGVIFGCVMEYIPSDGIIELAIKVPLLVIFAGAWMVSAVFAVGIPLAVMSGELG